MNEPVLIVGAGVVGLASALALRTAGLPVQVLERNPAPARESSWAGGGILCPLRPWMEPEAVQVLYRQARAWYDDWLERLRTASGIDPGFHRSGIRWVLPDPEERRRACEWLSAESLPFELAGQAVFCPILGQVRPPRLGRALAAAVCAAGGQIECGADAQPWIEDGRLLGVRVAGEPRRAPAVLLCAGAWSGAWAALAGAPLPVAPVKGQMLRFELPQSVHWPITIGEAGYVIPRGDGTVIAGSTLEHTGFDKGVTREAAARLHAVAVRLCPALADAPVAQQWAGLRPGSPEGVPWIGPSAVPSLWLNTGHHRNGLALAVASAERLTSLLLAALHHG